MRKDTDLDGVKAIAKALLMTAVNEKNFFAVNLTAANISATSPMKKSTVMSILSALQT